MANTSALILLIAGSSTRFNHHTKKQFVIVDNKPVFIHTLLNILQFQFDRIVIVAKDSEIEEVKQYVENFVANANSVEYVVGGAERCYSVYNAMKYIKNNNPTDYVFIHDGVRPHILLSEIKNLYQTLQEKDGAILAIKMADTVKKVDSDNKIIDTVDRSNLYRAATPQAFNFEKYYRAIDKYISQAGTKDATDDAQIYSIYNGGVYIVQCSSRNIKITEKSDLDMV